MGTLIQIREWKGRAMGDRDPQSKRGELESAIAVRSKSLATRMWTEGFTLVELLVVIAVLAVLMAILLPSLSRAREAGRRAACMGHMRQVQTAWQAYAVDHGDYIVNGQYCRNDLADDMLPNCGRPWLLGYDMGDYPNAGAAIAGMRTGALAPYLGDVRAYLCPGRYRNARNQAGKTYPWAWLSSYTIVGSMNFFVPESWTPWDRGFRAKYSVGRTILYVRRTSELVDPGPAARAVFLDTGMGPWRFCPRLDGTWVPDLRVDYGLPIHHAKGTNVSFGDGHIEHWKWTDPNTIVQGQRQVDLMILGKLTKATAIVLWRNPDWVRFFRAEWGKWPASLNGSSVH
jgi:prepilin-type N-terminal cleavage/methylation domain-containing protein/prepilin-type processing-associated H-X9-DG protein